MNKYTKIIMGFFLCGATTLQADEIDKKYYKNGELKEYNKTFDNGSILKTTYAPDGNIQISATIEGTLNLFIKDFKNQRYFYMQKKSKSKTWDKVLKSKKDGTVSVYLKNVTSGEVLDKKLTDSVGSKGYYAGNKKDVRLFKNTGETIFTDITGGLESGNFNLETEDQIEIMESPEVVYFSINGEQYSIGKVKKAVNRTNHYLISETDIAQR